MYKVQHSEWSSLVLVRKVEYMHTPRKKDN